MMINATLGSLIIAGLTFIVIIALTKIYFIKQQTDFEKKLRLMKKDGVNASYLDRESTGKTIKNRIYGFLDKIRNKIQTANNNTIATAKQNFEKCGWDSEYAEIITPIAHILLVILFVGLFFIAYYVTPHLKLLPTIVVGCVFILFAFVGYRSYDYIVDFYSSIRLKRLERDIPMVIDLLSICAESGLTFDRSLEKIAQEIVYLNYSLSKELAISAAELTILPDRRNAYNNMFKRIPLDIIRALSISMVYAEQHGISVTKTLSSLAEVNTQKFFYKVETKASKIPAKMTVPIIFFSIPIIGMIILGPAMNQIQNSALFK